LIIPEQIITRFNKKLLNIHFSLLPKYRGASPVQFAILNGDKVVGVSYMLTEKSVDTGAVIAQIEYKDIDKKTAGELYKELFELAARNLPKVINDYAENKIQPKTQNEAQASYTYSPTRPKNTFTYKEDAQINWAKTAEEIERATRAYNPWPIAWTTLKELTASLNQNLRQGINPELKVKIYKARVEKTANDENKLIIEQLQVEGKNKSDWKTFENGYVA
jgi:methionyl-tRNA formyltransferase